MAVKSSQLSVSSRRRLILLALALPLSLILVSQRDCLCGCSSSRKPSAAEASITPLNVGHYQMVPHSGTALVKPVRAKVSETEFATRQTGKSHTQP